MTKKKAPSELRSQQWFGRQDRDGFAYRSWVKGKGVPHDQFDGRPVIGICNTFSELTPCNSHFRTLAEQVKIGVYEAGGFPLEFPVMSLGETLLRPTAMLYRNLASMDVEESIRGNPVDGVVLLFGCDKTTPSLLMGASSVDLPAIAKVGRTALVVMLAGTLGIMIGGPVSFAVFQSWLPPDAWKGLAALSGSWIGGSANFVAIAESVDAPQAVLGPAIVVDTVVAYGWMAVLLALSAWQAKFDARTGALRRGGKRPGEEMALAVAVDASGARLALGMQDKSAWIQDCATGEFVRRLREKDLSGKW